MHSSVGLRQLQHPLRTFHDVTDPLLGDYCDVYLTHDSMSVRKAHNAGRNHLRNVVEYYQGWYRAALSLAAAPTKMLTQRLAMRKHNQSSTPSHLHMPLKDKLRRTLCCNNHLARAVCLLHHSDSQVSPTFAKSHGNKHRSPLLGGRPGAIPPPPFGMPGGPSAPPGGMIPRTIIFPSSPSAIH